VSRWNNIRSTGKQREREREKEDHDLRKRWNCHHGAGALEATRSWERRWTAKSSRLRGWITERWEFRQHRFTFHGPLRHALTGRQETSDFGRTTANSDTGFSWLSSVCPREWWTESSSKSLPTRNKRFSFDAT
jgi:hypothetical protein